MEICGTYHKPLYVSRDQAGVTRTVRCDTSRRLSVLLP